MKICDALIVGGGPAGMSAATVLAERGRSVVLLEEGAALGGKVLRRDVDHVDAGESRLTREVHDALASATGVSVTPNAVCYHLDSDLTVAAESFGKGMEFSPGAVVLAQGGLERSLPIPGWTLPGVMTLGGCASLAKRGALRGKRVFVAGTGPLPLLAAHILAHNGARIVGFAQPVSLWSQGMSLLPHLIRTGRMRKGLAFADALRRSGGARLSGWLPARCRGEGKLESVSVVRCDDRWRPVAGTERTFRADILACSYGLTPTLDLARMAGCEPVYDDGVSQWRIPADSWGQTDVPGLFVAGDGASVKGYEAALLEGRMAGLAAARHLGAISDQEAAAAAGDLRRRLRPYADLGSILTRLSAPGPGAVELVTPDTVVCRCEEVTAGDIQHACALGAGDMHDLKRRTRLGMGHCQGRYCGPGAHMLMERYTGRPVKPELYTPRSPARPVSFGALASAE